MTSVSPAMAICCAFLAAILAGAVILHALGDGVRDHLVGDAKSLWKRWSVWITGAQVTIALMWIGLPPAWQPDVPQAVRWGIVALLGAAAITAQALKQPGRGKPRGDGR